MQEYLAWGQFQGGRQGYPWSATHLRSRRRHLPWWQQTLGLAVLGDLRDMLPQVEAAVQRLSQDHEDLYAFASAGYPQDLYPRSAYKWRQAFPGEPLLYVPNPPPGQDAGCRPGARWHSQRSRRREARLSRRPTGVY